MDECRRARSDLLAPLKARLRLNTREEVEGVKRDKDVIEQEVYLASCPLITDSGTFIITERSADRVAAPPSPAFLDELTHRTEQLYNARYPYRGSWVEFSLEVNDVMHVHIDRKRKLPFRCCARWLRLDREISTLLREGNVEVKGKSGGASGRVAART